MSHITQHEQIFVNLAVKDLARSQAFFSALGYEFEANFTDDKAACLVLGHKLFAMLLVEPFFQGFVGDKALTDAHRSAEVLTCLSCGSRAEVDALVAKAVAAGGRAPRPAIDHGFMYSHGFEDPDGHIWELMSMDASAAANPDQDA